MDKFPILRLPLLSLKDVLGMLNVSELLKLSRCNKKLGGLIRSSKQIISFSLLNLPQKEAMDTFDVFELLHLQSLNGTSKFRKMNSMELDLFINTDIGVQFCLEDNYDLRWSIFAEYISDFEKFNGFESFLKIGEYNVPTVLTDQYELYTFWEDRLEGLKILMSWLMRTYYFRVEALDLRMGSQEKYSEDLRSIINFVSYRQSTFPNCRIDEENALMTDDNLKFIRDYVHVTNMYTHWGNRTEPCPYVPRYESRQLYVSYADWFKIDHLLTANCVYIHLEYTNLTNRDLNRLVEHWQNEHLPRLKHLIVDETPGIDLHQIVWLTDIRITSLIHDGIYKSMYDVIEFEHGHNITDRSQEKFATLICSEPHNDMITAFELMVWPDFDGYMHHDRNELVGFEQH